MSHRYYDVSKITLGENGKIELGDEQLSKLENEQIEKLTAGGVFYQNGEILPEFKVNWFWCDNDTNAGSQCRTLTSCDGSVNQIGCSNQGDCDISRNQLECTNEEQCEGVFEP